MKRAIFALWWAANALFLVGLIALGLHFVSARGESNLLAGLAAPESVAPAPPKRSQGMQGTDLLRNLPNPLRAAKRNESAAPQRSGLSKIVQLHGFDQLAGDSSSATAYLYLIERKIQVNAYLGEAILDGMTGKELPELAGWRLARLIPGGAVFRKGNSEAVLTIGASPWSGNLYRITDNVNDPDSPSFSAVWRDISSTGTPLPITKAANAWTNVALPILIRFHGFNWGTPPPDSGLPVITSNVEISANGFMALLAPGQPDPGAGLYANQPFPSTDNRIAPGGFLAVHWDDWQARGTNDSAQWQVVGTAPNRRFVVQWTNWSAGPSGDDMTFQVQITESDGVENSEIYMVYQGVNTPQEGGNSATIGIQAPNGGTALQYSFETAGFTTSHPASGDPRVIRFTTRPPEEPVAAQSGTRAK
ncbi:MAG: hypothetical protein HY716_07965 [Planctomycetes bacterium]|nr:hypothetical protein [Planctomycetota bacterium]